MRHDGRWHLFYTGIARAEAGEVQRIGHATSDDLLTWERDELLLEADPRWYDREHWRDPWVEWDPERERWDMLICATSGGRGILAHAHSADLRAWTSRPAAVAADRPRAARGPAARAAQRWLVGAVL